VLGPYSSVFSANAPLYSVLVIQNERDTVSGPTYTDCLRGLLAYQEVLLDLLFELTYQLLPESHVLDTLHAMTRNGEQPNDPGSG
jgi:hypothetical protein